jgi:hypothetical protein
MSPSDRVAQLYVYPQATGSLFFAFYDSQGYGGGILTPLHTGNHAISENIYSYTLKIEAVVSSETLVNTYQTIYCHIQEDSFLQTYISSQISTITELNINFMKLEYFREIIVSLSKRRVPLLAVQNS